MAERDVLFAVCPAVARRGARPETPASPPEPSEAGSALQSAIDSLEDLVATHWAERATVGEVEDALAGRGVGLLMVVLSVPFIVPVPIPLLATACGLPMVWMGLQMAMGRPALLPGRLRRWTLSGEALRRIAVGARRLTRPVSWLCVPRLAWLFRALPHRLTGLSIAAAALVLSLPIPIPFANMIPALALLHFAAGLLQRDGLAILVGHALTLATAGYLLLIGDTAWALVQAIGA